MKNFKMNLVALIGIFVLGIGVSNATSSSLDCGDDDAKPIIIHGAAKAINKEA